MKGTDVKYAEILKGLRAQRDEALAGMQAVHSKAVGEDRTLDADEQKSFDQFKSKIANLDLQIKNTEDMERLTGGSGQPVEQQPNPNDVPGQTVPPGNPGAPGTPVVPGSGQTGQENKDVYGRVQVVRNLPKGTAFTRYAMALAASKGNLMQAAETAKQWEGSTPEVSRVLKAAVAAGTTTDATWAAPLVEYRTMAEEFVELLRPATILGRLRGVRNVPFNVRIPRQTAGAAVGWVGEGAPKPVGRLSFDTITMPPTKIAGIVVITTELARFSSPAAEGLVRADMIESIAAFSDAQFINPAVAGVAGTNPASITYGATAAAASGTTLADIDADLMAARLYMVNNAIPEDTLVWVMSPATRMFLEELRTAQDVLAYPTLGTNGTLKGIPVIASASVGLFDADGAGAGEAAKFIALISTANILVADDGQVMLDSSSEASIIMDDAGAGATLTSLWQRNMIGIRAERFIHWIKRRPAAAYVITGVGY